MCAISEIKSGLELDVQGVNEDLHFIKSNTLPFVIHLEKSSLKIDNIETTGIVGDKY